jgi:hypothetical protein
MSAGLAVADSSSQSTGPSVGSVAAIHDEHATRGDNLDHSTYLTIKLGAKGKSSGTLRAYQAGEIANLLLVSDLRGLVKTIKEAQGIDHPALLTSFPENSGMGDSPVPAELFSPAWISSSAPPILPDFPWLGQPSLMIELIGANQRLEDGDNTATSPQLSHSRSRK